MQNGPAERRTIFLKALIFLKASIFLKAMFRMRCSLALRTGKQLRVREPRELRLFVPQVRPFWHPLTFG